MDSWLHIMLLIPALCLILGAEARVIGKAKDDKSSYITEDTFQDEKSDTLPTGDSFQDGISDTLSAGELFQDGPNATVTTNSTSTAATNGTDDKRTISQGFKMITFLEPLLYRSVDLMGFGADSDRDRRVPFVPIRFGSLINPFRYMSHSFDDPAF